MVNDLAPKQVREVGLTPAQKVMVFGPLITSVILIFPGITFPVFNTSIDYAITSPIFNFDSKILEKSQSIMGTILDLWERPSTVFVGTLIFLFSIMVPLVKCGLFFWVLIKGTHGKSYPFLKAIGKWSMADVFVVSIFLAFLSTRNQHVGGDTIQVMGLQVGLKSDMNSFLGPGFYFFLGYCLLSLLAFQLYEIFRKNH